MKKLNAADVQPIGEVLAAVTRVEAALSERGAIQQAIDRLAPRRAAVNKVADALSQRRANELANQALETDPDRAAAYHPRLDEIEREQTIAARERDGVESAQRALDAKLDEADGRLIELKNSQLPYTLMAQSTHVAHALQRRLDEIVEKHLVPFVVEVNAMHAATNSFTSWLQELTIRKLLGNHEMLRGPMLFMGVQTVRLEEAWQDDSDLAAAVEVASAPKRVLQQLRSAAARAEERAAMRTAQSNARHDRS